DPQARIRQELVRSKRPESASKEHRFPPATEHDPGERARLVLDREECFRRPSPFPRKPFMPPILHPVSSSEFSSQPTLGHVPGDDDDSPLDAYSRAVTSVVEQVGPSVV